ncbi:RNA-binding domain-containing protein [Linderina pennispora]|uniref:RNA-binding domain-containing protein n=2 Tax=Linderina pennispora TaxID=61395 RepID=A0A1Y1VYC5_9FUNG|nr:RNA-binding domain-containing protein [Linderina pennispora]ORX66243.1 RNA-binding domain-containing protein [Linderina pennispora]
MLPNRNRVRARKPLGSTRPATLSAEPVLNKPSAQPAPAESTFPPAQGGDASEQYTYVTDESGYTWLYNTVSGQYYYYDYTQSTYLPHAEPAKDHETDDKKPRSKRRRVVRMAGGQVWEDETLAEWPEDDYRLFAGNLGPDVTTEMLEQVFGKFPTMQRALVVVEKKSGKSKGYGFLSFASPDDFLAAWREFNGKYVGSRPIMLRKSTWKKRDADIRKVKRLDKRAFIEFKSRRK